MSTLLRAWSDGDQSALSGLTPIVYEELRRLAHHYMERERPGHTLQITAVVNMRLVDYTRMQWQDRAHFFAVSAQLTRRILVDHARSHNLKRGAGVPHLALDDVAVVSGNRTGDLVALNDAMNALGRLDPRKVQIVAVFRRTQRGGDGRSAQSLACRGEARLEHRQVLAVPRTRRRDGPWTRNGGSK
jgi:RNA polymerase sigma factor (TIGR02999 family)